MIYSHLWELINSSEDSKAKYNLLMRWAVLARKFPDGSADDTDTRNYNSLESLYKWLDNSGFYTAPASTQYHESYIGGLCDHTLKVVDNIITLSKLPVFSSVDLASAILVALVHDWCKIGFYTSYDKNVKDATGNWVKTQAFKYSGSPMIALGHGAASMYLASKWFNLSDEEALAIRWHMGAWRIVDSECNELQYANENYPLVHMLQFADQLSITKYFTPNNL
jgi:hypothetical protein